VKPEMNLRKLRRRSWNMNAQRAASKKEKAKERKQTGEPINAAIHSTSPKHRMLPPKCLREGLSVYLSIIR